MGIFNKLQPLFLVPETNALSMLSYGRIVDSKGLKKSADCSNWPTVAEIVPEIRSRWFAASLGNRETVNTNSNSLDDFRESSVDLTSQGQHEGRL